MQSFLVLKINYKYVYEFVNVKQYIFSSNTHTYFKQILIFESHYSKNLVLVSFL